MLHEFLTTALSLLFVWTLLLLAPGSDFILMLRNTMRYGYRAGLFTGFGITLAISVHIVIAITGIYFLSKSSLVYTVVQIIGAIYLIYLGVSALLQERQQVHLANEESFCTVEKNLSYFKQGFFCNIFNPKAPIVMLGIFTQLIPYSSTATQKIFFSALMIVISFIVWSLLAKLISSHIVKEKLNQYSHRIAFVSNIVLILLGGYVFFYDLAR